MLHEHIECFDSRAAAKIVEGGVARYCNFSKFVHEGAHVDSVFIGCSFTGVEWYWGLFNWAVFIDCRFTECMFRGTSFADTKFVECVFDRCQFTAGNIGGGCTNDRSRMYGGQITDSPGAEVLGGAF